MRRAIKLLLGCAAAAGQHGVYATFVAWLSAHTTQSQSIVQASLLASIPT